MNCHRTMYCYKAVGSSRYVAVYHMPGMYEAVEPSKYDHKTIRYLVFVFLPRGLGWYIPRLSRPPTWAPPPSITCRTVQLFFDFFLHNLHDVSSCEDPTELNLAHHQLSSAQQLIPALAQQRSTLRCGAVPCPAMRCGTARCCAVLCRAARFATLALSCNARYHTKHSAQQRSAVRCDTVRCCAVLCRAACFAVLIISYKARYHLKCHTRCRYTFLNQRSAASCGALL